jgi:hypothetical protein
MGFTFVCVGFSSVCVKKAQSDGLLSKNAPDNVVSGQTPPLLQGLDAQQPQKVGFVELQDQNDVFGVEHSPSWRLFQTWPPMAVLSKPAGKLM